MQEAFAESSTAAAAAAAATAAAAAAASMEWHEEASGRLVLLRQPQIDGVTLEKWLGSPAVDDDPLGVWSVLEAEDPELPWEECPEAVMEHSLDLSNSILQKLGNEIKSLARLMEKWT